MPPKLAQKRRAASPGCRRSRRAASRASRARGPSRSSRRAGSRGLPRGSGVRDGRARLRASARAHSRRSGCARSRRDRPRERRSGPGFWRRARSRRHSDSSRTPVDGQGPRDPSWPRAGPRPATTAGHNGPVRRVLLVLAVACALAAPAAGGSLPLTARLASALAVRGNSDRRVGRRGDRPPDGRRAVRAPPGPVARPCVQREADRHLRGAEGARAALPVQHGRRCDRRAGRLGMARQHLPEGLSATRRSSVST